MGFKRKIKTYIKNNKLMYAILKKPLKYRFDRKMQWKRDAIKNYGIECLLLMKESFKEHKQEFWLDYGTLLGAVREKDFIEHDLDMDLGTFDVSEEKKRALEKTLNDKGIKTLREFRINGNIVEQTFTYKEAHIDIFYYYCLEETQKIWCYFFEETDNMIKKENGNNKIVTGWKAKTATSTFLGVNEIEFKGEKFPSPINIEQYLVENYGPNFMIKDDEWDYANSGNNIQSIEVNDIKAIYK